MRILLLLLFLFPINAEAGAWLQKEGEGQLIFNTFYYTADQQWNAKGDKGAMPKFTKIEAIPYMEYGLTEDITIGGSFSYKRVQNETDPKERYGIDDPNIFVRLPLYEGEMFGEPGFVVSLQPGLFLPLKTSGDINDQTGLSPRAKLNIGYGTNAYYADASAGYEYWHGEAKKLSLEATLGYYLSDDFTAMAQVFSSNIIGNNYNTNRNFDLTKVQGSLLWDYNDSVSHQLGLYKDVYGRNTGSGYGFLYSVWYKF